MIEFLFILGLLLAFLLCCTFFNNEDIVKIFIIAVFSYFCYYTVTSGILFTFDLFSLKRSTAIVAGAELLVILLRRKNLDFHFCSVPRQYIIPILILLLTLPFIWSKFGFFGMGQDQGVYQTQAIAFLNGNFKNQKDFKEYYDLPEEDQDDFEQFVKSYLVGYYLYDEELPTLALENKISSVSGFYHGIPTFSAILALWGTVFGMSEMSGVQSLFYIITYFFIYFCCINLRLKKFALIMVLLLFSMSPIIIWVSKASLTEMFLACIILAFLYFLTNKSTSANILFSVMAVITFAFYHMTIYTLIPIFLLLYWLIYLISGRRQYLYASVAVLAGFVIGITAMTITSATYCFTYNFTPLYQFGGIINQNNVLPIIWFVSVIAAVLTFLLPLVRKWAFVFLKNNKFGEAGIKFAVISYILIQLMLTVSKLPGYETGYDALLHTTAGAFYVLTGMVVFPVTLVFMFFKAKQCFRNMRLTVLSALFLYCILFYSCFLRTDIPYYYYYGRYTAPFIGILLLMFGIFVSENKSCILAGGILTATAVMIQLPFNLVLLDNQDDTRISFKILEDLRNLADQEDVIYMSENLGMLLYLPVRELTGATVFPITTGMADEVIQKANDGKGDIFYLSGEREILNSSDIIYRNYYETIENKNDNDSKWMALPRSIIPEKKSLTLYRKNIVEYEYLVWDSETSMSGYYDSNEQFRWIHPDKNEITCYLDVSDYIVKISQKDLIPVDKMDKPFNVSLIVNGKMVEHKVLGMEERGEELDFYLPAAYVNHYKNQITLKCTSWSPSQFGSPDSRKLGLGIEKIVFEKVK